MGLATPFLVKTIARTTSLVVGDGRGWGPSNGEGGRGCASNHERSRRIGRKRRRGRGREENPKIKTTI